MTNKTQPEALRLAEMLTADEWPGSVTLVSYARECVAELLRQHARITALESQLAQRFDAADVATAAAQGFRDGAASAMAGEPMAWMTFTEEGDPDMVFIDRLEACQYCEDDDPPKPLYLAAPPTAQAEGWRPISTAPRDGTEVLADTSGLGRVVVYWDDEESQWGTGLGYLDRGAPTHWMPLPPPPTSAEGVEHE